MALQELNPELLVGIESIDNNHGRIFAALYDIHIALIDKEEHTVLAQKLHKLITEIDAQFEPEERLLEEISLPNSLDHRMKHEELFEELLRLDWEYLNGKSKITDASLQLVMKKVAEHIVTFDKPAADLYKSGS